MSRILPALALALLLAACEREPTDREVDEPTPVADGDEEEEPLRLGVPPRVIHRARREALGLSKMPPLIRTRALEEGRARELASYDALLADREGRAQARVSFSGRVPLVRPAGPELWIMLLESRHDGERFRDPLYVLSVIRPPLPEDTPSLARVEGWAVGHRTIGRHTLPLIVAFHVEAVERRP